MDRLMLKYEEKEETEKEQMATQKRKTGIGFGMKENVKEKDEDFSGAQLKHLFDKWSGNDKT